MDVADMLRIGVRWAHALAAAAWVGGGLFYLWALNPALRELGATPERRELLERVGREFREVVRLGILVFVLTGAVLTFDRLSQPAASTPYVAVLSLKVALSLWMFWLATRLGRSLRSTEAKPGPAGAGEGHWWSRTPSLLLALGLTVFFLAELLKVIFERNMV